MRIASLLPSATEILFSLGLSEDIIAVSHECDFPSEASARPVLTQSALHQKTHKSADVNREVAQRGGDIYNLDESLLERLQPDLILTQELCNVCAVSYTRVKQAARLLDAGTKIVSLEPTTLEDILDNILLVGRLTDRSRQAEELVQKLRDRIETVRNTTCDVKDKPRVFFMEWLQPPWSGGHWIPQMIDFAGGTDGLGRLGRPSHRIEWKEVVEYRPEIVVLSPCGYDVSGVLDELHVLDSYDGWDKIPAFKTSNIYAVNASSYFSRPGPRIVDGLELLAHIIHPELFQNSPKPQDGVRVGHDFVKA